MKFLGVILTGGKSQRMGQDKALMDWQGQTWMSHMAELLLAAGADDILVCGPQSTPFVNLCDHFVDSGPLGGIHAALKYALSKQRQPLLIAPVDIPSATADDLKALVKPRLSAEVVSYSCSPLPCFVRPSLTLLSAAEAILTDKDQSNAVRHWFARLKHHELNIAPPFKNFNESSDLIQTEKQ